LFIGMMACDGGGGGGGTNVDLGDDGKVASSMSQAEAEQACKNVSAQMEKAYEDAGGEHVGCLVAGTFAKAMAGGDVAACQKAYDSCMEEPDEESGDDCEEAYEELKDCNATLGEIEACMDDQVGAMEEGYAEAKKLNCSSTEEELKALGEIFDSKEELSQACKTVQEKCPSMVEEDEETEPAPPLE
jgi:hypothetical protein